MHDDRVGERTPVLIAYGSSLKWLQENPNDHSHEYNLWWEIKPQYKNNDDGENQCELEDLVENWENYEIELA
jgi:hypothetical protein